MCNIPSICPSRFRCIHPFLHVRLIYMDSVSGPTSSSFPLSWASGEQPGQETGGKKEGESVYFPLPPIPSLWDHFRVALSLNLSLVFSNWPTLRDALFLGSVTYLLVFWVQHGVQSTVSPWNLHHILWFLYNVPTLLQINHLQIILIYVYHLFLVGSDDTLG